MLDFLLWFWYHFLRQVSLPDNISRLKGTWCQNQNVILQMLLALVYRQIHFYKTKCLFRTRFSPMCTFRGKNKAMIKFYINLIWHFLVTIWRWSKWLWDKARLDERFIWLICKWSNDLQEKYFFHKNTTII